MTRTASGACGTALARSFAAAVLGLIVAAGCRPARPPVALAPPPAPPAPPPSDMVVLIADPGTNTLGRVAVQAQGQTIELASEREMTRIVPGEAPSAPATLPEEEFKERFGAVLDSRAPEPLFFQLYFETGGNTLVPDSQALLTKTVEIIRTRPIPDVVVIGHTDTTGDSALNARVGLQRATLIRDRLIAAGVSATQIEATSHGEADPLVPTDDNVAEARNRRVEITVH